MLKDAGKPYAKDAAQAKLMASETATFSAHQAIQVLRCQTELWLMVDVFLCIPCPSLLAARLILALLYSYRSWEAWDLLLTCLLRGTTETPG